MSESVHWHRGLSIKELGRRLLSAPMLVALLLLVGGILLARYFVLPPLVAEVALCILVGVGWFSKHRAVSWGYAAVALLMLGYVVVEYRTPYASLPYDTVVEMEVDVVGIPSQKEGYSVAEGRILRWREEEAWQRADDKVQLWLRTDSIGAGDRVAVWGELREQMSRYEGYDALLRSRGYVGGVSISDVNIVATSAEEHRTLHQRAVAKLERYTTDSLSHATVEAMVAGTRHAMPKVLREAYADTGLAHLLAVSGLHLGIVAMVVMALLMPLRLLHRGHRVANVVVIVAIWAFAAMSGMSASVVRAAIMLSMLQLARLTSSVSNSVNILAVTLFAMLVYRPSYLYDISFQLSALAVAGILLWGVPLIRAIGARGWMLRAVTSTVVVGVVATLWTLPVVSHTFGNLPLAGVVITPVVMLFAYVIVGAGLFAIILPGPLAMSFAMVAEYCAGLQNSVVMWAAERGFTGVEYTMSNGGVAVCYALFVAITIVVWSIYRKKVVTLPKYVNQE